MRAGDFISIYTQRYIFGLYIYTINLEINIEKKWLKYGKYG